MVWNIIYRASQKKVGFWISNSPVVWDDQRLIKLTDTSSFCSPLPCSKMLKVRHKHHRPIIQHNRALENLNTTGLLAIQKPTFFLGRPVVEMRGGVTDAGQRTNDERTLKIELLCQWKPDAEFRNERINFFYNLSWFVMINIPSPKSNLPVLESHVYVYVAWELARAEQCPGHRAFRKSPRFLNCK